MTCCAYPARLLAYFFTLDCYASVVGIVTTLDISEFFAPTEFIPKSLMNQIQLRPATNSYLLQSFLKYEGGPRGGLSGLGAVISACRAIRLRFVT